MVYKRYDSPFEKKSATPPADEFIKPEKEHREEEAKQNFTKTDQGQKPGSLGFLDNLSYDDIILIALIVILLAENKENRDVPLILTLGFLFLVQYIDAD